ncbi:phage major capsid protein [Ferrimonas balearica]|uniref:phage major capsid protein n=1 Tax=Ferrimonas balearica TaxID=44012 RepID=UPI001C966F99|nr:phage major capsid protein [Ferrimonas balearica]MBY6104901.1 phage major capsid protein [Ferrimonas balearica]
MATNKRKINGEPLHRSVTLASREINEEARTVEVAFSSEEPVPRWFGTEILDHATNSVRLSRLADGGAVLMDHNHRDQVGVIESVSIDSDRRGRATLRFGRSQRAQEAFQDVVDGIKRHISVGYRVHKYERTKGADGAPDTVRITDWEPFEVSFVSVPADATVGVGRSQSTTDHQESQMDDEIQTENTPAATENRSAPAPAPAPAPATINADEIRSQERQRLSAIEAAASQSSVDLSGLRSQAIEQGWTAERFRAEAFEKIAAEQVEAPAARAADDMLERSKGQEYSLVRAIAAQHSGDWTNAGFEREMSQELARNSNVIGGGLLVPAHVLGQRATDTTNAAGLIGTAHRPDLFIDTLRAESIMGRAGATFLPGLVGKMSAPKKTANAQFGFKGEGDPADKSNVTVGKVEMSGKHISGEVEITFEMLRQSAPAIEQIVRQDILEGLALAIDFAAINGDGTGNNPLGIMATPGIHTVTAADTTGKLPTWAEILKMEGALDDANALKGRLAYLFRSTIATQLKGISKDAGSGRFIMENGEVNGYAAMSTTQLPALASLFGNFADLWIGTWGVVELLPERNKSTGGLDIGVHQMVDMAVRNAQSFAKIV